jgi:uncharacterized RDD family membrane protein YckC
MSESNFIKAPLGKRLAAYLIDCLICLPCMIPGIILFYWGYSIELDITNLDNNGLRKGLIGGGATLAALLAGLYLLLRDGLNGGKSYGKKWLGLEVVRLDNGERCNYGKSALRNIQLSVSAIPYWGWALGLIEVIMTLANPQGKRVGDLLSKTMVVEQNSTANSQVLDA